MWNWRRSKVKTPRIGSSRNENTEYVAEAVSSWLATSNNVIPIPCAVPNQSGTYLCIRLSHLFLLSSVMSLAPKIDEVRVVANDVVPVLFV